MWEFYFVLALVVVKYQSSFVYSKTERIIKYYASARSIYLIIFILRLELMNPYLFLSPLLLLERSTGSPTLMALTLFLRSGDDYNPDSAT